MSAIDAGSRSTPYANEPEPNGRRVNLGRYGNTQWASLSRSKGLYILVR